MEEGGGDQVKMESKKAILDKLRVSFSRRPGQMIVCDFGLKEGIKSYRINGSREDLETLIHSLETIGLKMYRQPEIVQTYPRSMHTMLLEVIVPD
jgi:hypothetical protein